MHESAVKNNQKNSLKSHILEYFILISYFTVAAETHEKRGRKPFKQVSIQYMVCTLIRSNCALSAMFIYDVLNKAPKMTM